MIKAALIGLGKMGISHHSIINAHPDVNLVAVCDTSKFMLAMMARAIDIKTYSDVGNMLKDLDLDAVFVATPTDSHVKIVQMCLDANLHVFCEKPFCLNPADGQKIAELALEKQLISQVGYHYRFVGAFAEAKRLVAAGTIGKIHNTRVEAYGPVVLQKKGTSWRSKKSSGGGCLYDYASHAIDLLIYCLGTPNAINSASLNSIFSRDVDDEVYASFDYADGATAQMLANWSDESHRKMSTKLSIWGQNGRITADRQEIQVFVRNPDYAPQGYGKGWNIKNTMELTAPVRFYLRGEEYSAQIDHFVENIKTGNLSGENSFFSALETDKIAAGIRQAADLPKINLTTMTPEISPKIAPGTRAFWR